MTISQAYMQTTPILHVFEQAGGWHWGITVRRTRGTGFKLIAFSEKIFPVEDIARTDGSRVLVNLADSDMRDRLATGPAGEEPL
jgi:hypothetical protein